jgi:hypothetical protein
VADDIVVRLAREHDFRVFTASDDLPGITMMSEAERRQEAATEIERLRAAVDVVLAEVGNHHRPNSDGRGCWWCGPGDGSWPCVHRMVLDELKEARRG